MTSQPLSRRMMRTNALDRRRFELVAAEFLVRMGDRIRTQREKLGLSRPDVARLMPGKVSENQIYRWEIGKHQPNPDTLEALARVLECDVAYFMAPALVEVDTPDPFPLEPPADLSKIKELLEDMQRQELERYTALLARLDGIEVTIRALARQRPA